MTWVDYVADFVGWGVGEEKGGGENNLSAKLKQKLCNKD